MVMDQFVTTYRKDYLWPYIKTLGVRPHPEIHQYNRENAIPCECHNIAKHGVNQHGREQDILGPLAYQEESWSRLGPMGPLLDPKIYPAKVSSAPESHVSRFNQPNVFLQKLQEKYPFIYECLRTAPPDDLIARINKDRLSSTYQVDYCRKREYPSAPYDELLRAAGVEGSASCPEPITLPGDTCKMYRNSRVTDSGASRGSHPCGGIYKAKEAAYCAGLLKKHPRNMLTAAKQCVPDNNITRNKALRQSTITKYFVESGMPSEKEMNRAHSGDITMWDPFSDSPKKYDPVIETWGKMVYRQSPQRHHQLT